MTTETTPTYIAPAVGDTLTLGSFAGEASLAKGARRNVVDADGYIVGRIDSSAGSAVTGLLIVTRVDDRGTHVREELTGQTHTIIDVRRS